MNNEQRIKTLEKAVTWLISGYKIGDKVLYYDISNNKQYGKIIRMKLVENNGFVPTVSCKLKNLKDDEVYFCDIEDVGRKLTNFDLKHIEKNNESVSEEKYDNNTNTNGELHTHKYGEWISLNKNSMIYPEWEYEDLNININYKINHPSHYTKGEIECIDYIEDKDFNYHIGNAIKYLTRYRYKDNPVKDLEKAIWYIKREIKRRQQ